MDRFAFLSGLPRSGSTLLGTLLSQHPSLYVSPTSSIREMVDYVLKFKLAGYPYFDLNDPLSPGWAAARGLLYGAYEHIEKEVVIEKERGWPASTDLIERLTHSPPKILATVRPLPEIIASFIQVSKRNGSNSQIEKELSYVNRESNPWTLSRMIWERYVSLAWSRFKAGYENHPEAFHLVEYGDLVADPVKVINGVHEYLGVETLPVETLGISNPVPEDDSMYGLKGLHDIRGEVKRTSPPAEFVLGAECYAFWEDLGLEFWAKG